MPDRRDYYVVWTGTLHMGDTPGVFMDGQYAGLVVQFPVSVTYVDDNIKTVELLFETTEVEIFDGKKHAVYWDWNPGSAFPAPVGFIDDTDPFPGQPELHPVSVPVKQAAKGAHTIAIHINPDVKEGMRDDFVLKRLEAHNTAGVKIGW
ncbi:MAG: hypothetical protein AMXMBFR84_33770 [Candidatus Hydrogenedentota bacterium]